MLRPHTIVSTVAERARRLVNAIHPWMGVYVAVGAGTGDAFADLVGRYERIFAIEPDPALAAGLRKRFARAANVQVIEAAPGDLDLFFSEADVQYVDTYVSNLGAADQATLATLQPWIAERLIGSITCGSAAGVDELLGDRYERVADTGSTTAHTWQARHPDRG